MRQPQTDEGLKREVNTLGLTSNIINIVIGSGIFVLPATVSAGLGAAGIFAYLICSVLIALVMLCFAELGSKITTTGGAYAYIENAFGKYAGFLTTNVFIFGASAMAGAAVANALADMLGFLFPVFRDYGFRVVFFTILFAALATIHIMGIRQGITLVIATTVGKLIPIAILIILGVAFIEPENLRIESWPPLSMFGEVSVVLFFAFLGGENSLSVGGEVKDPQRTFPRAILFSFLIILLIYLAVQIVAQGILGESLSTVKAPLAETASRILGPAGITMMTIGASISMFGYLSSNILNMPRVMFRAAKDKVLPIPALAQVHPQFATPWVSVVGFTLLTYLLTITGEFRQLAILASSSVLLMYLGVAAATIKLRKRSFSGASFTIPGGPTVPLLAMLVIIWFLLSLQTADFVAMAVFLTVLTILYVIMQGFRAKR